MNEKALEHYLSAVRRRLPCGGERRRELLSGLREEILDRISERPITPEALERIMGSPKSVAVQMTEEVADCEAQQYHRKRLFKMIAAAVLAALILWGGVVIWSAIRVAKLGPGEIIESMHEGTDLPVDDPYWSSPDGVTVDEAVGQT